MLTDFDIEAFFLCAIHANIPSYKMAFLLNKHLELRLERAKNDVEVNHVNHKNEVYPKYVFYDNTHYVTYTLIKNKCVMENTATPTKLGGLFAAEPTTHEIKKLIAEYKNVDYFLKIEAENDAYSMKVLASKILNIKHVITSYEVDYSKIKKKTNLIFE